MVIFDYIIGEKMKKIIMGAALAASLLSIHLSADMYVGIDMLSSKNTFTVDVNGLGSASVDDDSKAFKLKIGSSNSDGWRYQGYYLRETYDVPVFDATNDALNEIGLDVIKGFEVTPEFSPFLQAGFGIGSMSINGYSESSILEYNLKVGAGLMYKITQSIEAIVGADYQYRAWQDIQVGTVTISTSEKSTKLYAGLNYHF